MTCAVGTPPRQACGAGARDASSRTGTPSSATSRRRCAAPSETGSRDLGRHEEEGIGSESKGALHSQRQRSPAPEATPALTRLVSPFAGGDDISNCLHHDVWRFQVHVVSGVHDTLRAC